jgi:hypothetical protein
MIRQQKMQRQHPNSRHLVMNKNNRERLIEVTFIGFGLVLVATTVFILVSEMGRA